MAQQPKLLSDDQVRRFIADGFITLDAGLDPGFNRHITDELGFTMRYEHPPAGDNIVARLPALDEMLRSPVVHGAMISLLGPDFAWTPHRAVHNSEPLESTDAEFDPFEHAPKMGKGSMSGSGWHQDGHSIAGRSRWHTSRAANMFYFPHDVPLEMGPTRLLAGSHLYGNLHDIGPEQVVMNHIPAGTVIVTAFDIGHAGTPNRTDTSRYMLKFVALRQQNPTAPSWDNRDPNWRTPEDLICTHDVPKAWASLWNWLRGAPRSEGVAAADHTKGDALPALMEELRTRHQGQRLASLYEIIAMGEPAIDTLVDALLATPDQDRHISPAPSAPAFGGHAKDHLQRHFSNRQFVPEDAAVALGGIGKPAIGVLVPMLKHNDPWVRLNVAYALAEIGRDVTAPDADKVGALLDDPVPAVVRVACDALCSLSQYGPETEERLHRLLTDDRAGWDDVIMGKRWTNRNQIHYVACWALLARVSAGFRSDEIEAALLDALDDPTGYVPALAVEALKRLGTVSALSAAVDYLAIHRWDHFRHHLFRDRIEQSASQKVPLP